MSTSRSRPDKTQVNRDPDMVSAEVAMKRAALKARMLAEKTGTAIVYMEEDVIHEERPGQAHSGSN